MTPTDTLPTVETARKLGLLPDEYDKICGILGRKPNFTELSVYAVMWSEHCSYKNSIVWLKQLPKTGSRVMAAAGEENAGMLDIGDGLAVVFKIESHNHPSAIEPYQGAATGVGGIHRDIFTMGARPIAALNSLRFGDLSLPKTRHLLRGVVRGIGDYGNAFGVPTVGGEVFFDPCYNTNPLVNAMSVGIVRRGATASATANGVGNPVFIVGSATGKDGIHGATFASEDISEKSSEKLPAVQVGDPFTEKLLLEASLEAIATGAVVGMQDMGAAGIACSTSEMSARGGVGMDLWMDKVPTRQAGMVPWEMLLSESQERMLIVAHKDKAHLLQAVFDKWDLNCVQIGLVTDTGRIRYYHHGQLVGDVPADSLVLGGGAPVYQREYTEPTYREKVKAFSNTQVRQPAADEYAKILHFLLTRPSIASKRWVRRQYDSMVGAQSMTSNTLTDGALVHIHGTRKAMAMSADCNPRYVYADPRVGCALAVAEAARNIACAGGQPLGVTNCLNFGNPYNPEVYWQFKESILGMKDACEAFDIPVTGGNVSFYNQSEDGPVFPTPTIGMVGLLEDAERQRMDIHYKGADELYLVGQATDDMGSSEYLYAYHNITHSPAPYLHLGQERLLHATLRRLIEEKLIRSAHDVSDGGLLVNVVESALRGGFGCTITTPQGLRKDAFLFGEGGGRVVVSVPAALASAFVAQVQQQGLPVLHLGQVTTATDIVVDGQSLGQTPALREAYLTALERLLGEQPASV